MPKKKDEKDQTKPAEPEKPRTTKKYKLHIKFMDELLASAPANKEVYQKYIQDLTREQQEAKGQTDETQTLPVDVEEVEKTGWSVFHEDGEGLLIYDYVVRGYFKEVCAALFGNEISAYKSKIDKWIYVFPRRLHLHKNGDNIRPFSDKRQTEEYVERPIRAMTAQGPRVSLKRSNCVRQAEVTCEIHVLPLGQREFTEAVLRKWLDHGVYNGLGEWRTGSNGRFEYYELTPLEP